MSSSDASAAPNPSAVDRTEIKNTTYHYTLGYVQSDLDQLDRCCTDDAVVPMRVHGGHAADGWRFTQPHIELGLPF